MTRTAVEAFLAGIGRELYGLNAKDRAAILTELDNHIRERASDRARNAGLDEPDEEILEKVIDGMGRPEDIAREYMKVSMKQHELESMEHPDRTGAKQKMLYLVSAVAAFLGLFLTGLRHDAHTQGTTTSSQPYFPLGFALIIISVLTVGYARWIYPLKGRGDFDRWDERLYFIGVLITFLVGTVVMVWLWSVIDW